MEPFLLKPACKDYIWGGTKLKTEYGKQTPLNVVAECWECSVHPDGLSVIATGPCAGQTLAAFLQRYPLALGNRYEGECAALPILVKLIDAESDLSIQVHPDDAFAQKHEGQLGKTELWYVLNAEEGASLVYGFAHDVTAEELRTAVKADTLMRHLQRVPVRAGDVFFIEPGTVHAIGGGVVLVEVQESSNVTYRLYDYGRCDKNGELRELHVEKALSVMNRKAAPGVRQKQRIIQYTKGMARELVGRCRYFQVERLRIQGAGTVPKTASGCYVLVVISGSGSLRDGNAPPLSLKAGDTVFVPAEDGAFCLQGQIELLLVKI